MAKASFPLKKRIELVEQCFEFVKTGQPVGKFADLIGIPRTTLYGWLRRYPRMSVRNSKSMVPITRHSCSLSTVAPCSLETPAHEPVATEKVISIELGYCRLDIPESCSSDTITTLLKCIKGAR